MVISSFLRVVSMISFSVAGGATVDGPVLEGRESENGSGYLYFSTILRTVPTIVIAHTFCASPDTRISYRRCLLIQGYFCAV